jgi:uncharacterized repeat protein (TIGR01451 family)
LSVPFTNNSLSPQYRQYISYPEQVLPEPSAGDVPTITNFRFTDLLGIDNTISPNSTTGVQDSGFFKFQTNTNGTYAVIIDVDDDGNTTNGYNPDGIFGVGDIFLRGDTNSSGEVSVPWNGKTNLGAILPDGTYQAKLQAIVGEYHFIAGDVENSGPTTTGLFVKRAVSQNGTSDVNNYWDDITGLSATISGGTSSLPNGFVGGTGHRWGTTGSGGSFGDNTTSFGNLNYIDTYVYGKFTIALTPAIIISGTTDSNDFGDAPDTYGTNKDISVGGVPASHILSTTLRLGSTATDAETDGQPTTAANGDDINGTPDDEDGVTTFNTLTTASTNYSLSVSFLKNISGNVYLVGWIDFNRNGTFEASEGVSQTLTNTASTTNGTATLNWTGLSGLSPGTTYARFRINKDPMTTSNPTGGGTYGEVEDYQLTIISNTDYGDAPDTGASTATGNYKTTQSDGGARHDIVAGLRLGSQIDADNGTLQNTNANADDTTGTPNDEDGVTFPNTLTTESGQTYTVPASVTNSTGNPSYLVGYIDFNQDGDFDDTGEKSATVTVPTNATNPRSFNVIFNTPSGIVAGSSYARFRLSNTQIQAEASTGNATSGEVEDYPITINAVDYGDAPDTAIGTGTGNYKTTLSDNGARHILVSGLRLGSQIDADNGTLQNTNADADDTNGTPDDEEGVTSFAALTTEINKSYTVPVNITNSTGNPAYLVGYIDFNRDGDFNDAGEQSATVTIANNATTNPRSFNVSFTTPNTIVTGTTYARFRLSATQAQAESSIGLANSGEVEDYPLTITPAVPPQLKLLKRITNVTRAGNNITPPTSQPFTSFNEDGIANNDDNNTKWPDSNSATGNNSDATNDYLKGAINGGQVLKNDVIEYTIYFLNTGGLDAANVKLCDRIPVNTTFVSDAFGTGQGISLALNNAALPTTQNIIYTNDRTDLDKGKYFPAGVEPTGCVRQTTPNVFVPITAADNVNGTISVEIPLIPDSTGQNPFAPNDAYGFIRFRAKVNPQ